MPRNNENRMMKGKYSDGVRSTSNSFSYTCSVAECVEMSNDRDKRVKHAA